MVSSIARVAIKSIDLQNEVNVAKFLTTAGCSYYLEKIVKETENRTYLVSPFIDMNNQILDCLKAKNDSIKTVIIYGKKEKQQGLKEIKQLKNTEIYYKENLHAKAYYNEKMCLMTSLNLLEYSQVNNIEYGILVEKGEDSKLYKEITEEIEKLISISKKIVQNVKVLESKNENEYTMREIGRMFSNKWLNIKYKPNEYDQKYMAICKCAMEIHSFNKDEFYQDGRTGIYRHTILSKESFDKIVDYINLNLVKK